MDVSRVVSASLLFLVCAGVVAGQQTGPNPVGVACESEINGTEDSAKLMSYMTYNKTNFMIYFSRVMDEPSQDKQWSLAKSAELAEKMQALDGGRVTSTLCNNGLCIADVVAVEHVDRESLGTEILGEVCLRSGMRCVVHWGDESRVRVYMLKSTLPAPYHCPLREMIAKNDPSYFSSNNRH